MNFSSGLIGLQFEAQKKPGEKEGQKAAAAAYVPSFDVSERKEVAKTAPHLYVAVIPCDPFLNGFKDEIAFAHILEQKGKLLVEEWPLVNKGVVDKEKRIMVERQFTLLRNSYPAMRGGLEYAEYEMQLSSWGYTQKARAVDHPEELTLKDIKASFSSFFYKAVFLFYFLLNFSSSLS